VRLCQQLDPEKSRSGIFRCIRPFPGPAVQQAKDPAPSGASPFQIRVPSLQECLCLT